VSEKLRRLLFLVVITALILTLRCTAHGQIAKHPLRLAAAADLQPVLPPIIDQFHQQTGITVLASYHSSATLAMQILNQAPFDLFMAADMSYAQYVIDRGAGVGATPIPYARGTLVLWTRNDSGIPSLSLDALRNASIRTIAIANPKHAPYGRAAQQTLIQAGLMPAVKSRLVIAENIAQAAQYAESGNAQVGFISLTSALTPRLSKSGHYIRIPQQDYAPLIQGAVVVKGAKNAAAAHRFLEFLAQPKIRALLAAAGLESPTAEPPE
jgi:molybdate transport system substrate-binding protein